MSVGVVCYLERSHGGSVLTRVRLMAIGLSRSWAAPEAQGALADSVPAGAPGGGPALASVRSAARWVAETLQSVGIKRIATVCCDADGSICAWLSAPSADPPVIRATIAHSEHDGDGNTAGLGAGRLLALAASGVAASGTNDLGSGLGTFSDATVQALASPEAPTTNGTSSSRSRLLPGRGKSEQSTQSVRRNRYAVLAVPDAPVRVFLDELDARGIEVQSVTSLWHAMGRAWTEPETAQSNDPLVTSTTPTSAIVLIEPATGATGAYGRLIWSWARGGELIAGGTMRLRTLAPATPIGPTDALAQRDAETRRVQPPAATSESEAQIEFAQADAGRLAVDWLSWSAQLGQCPRRIVLVVPPNATDEQGSGPTSLGRHFARAWPKATIDAAVYDEPVQATISRIAGVRHGPEDNDAPLAIAAPMPDHTRAALVGLSSRPGKADRGMHRWAALGITAAALAVGVVGWQLRSNAADLADKVVATSKATREMLVGIENVVPGVSNQNPKDQASSLEAKRNELRDQAKKIRAPRPVLEESVRALAALEGHGDIEVSDFMVGMINGNIQIEIPESAAAAEVGPAILKSLESSPGDLVWTGTSSNFTSNAGKRRYVLLGTWPRDEVPGGMLH